MAVLWGVWEGLPQLCTMGHPLKCSRHLADNNRSNLSHLSATQN